MEKTLLIFILIILVIVAYVSIVSQIKLNNIEKKLGIAEQKIMDVQSQNTQPGATKDVTAGDLSSGLRSKLSGENISELNVKFQ